MKLRFATFWSLIISRKGDRVKRLKNTPFSSSSCRPVSPECFTDASLIECSLFYRFFATTSGWTLPALFAILRDLKDLAFDVSALLIPLLTGQTNRLTRLVTRQITKLNLWNARRRRRGLPPRRSQRASPIGETSPLQFPLTWELKVV